MLSEFKNNGYIILRNAFSKELLEYTNSTWDKLKERPFADHFPTVKGEHISASSWELPLSLIHISEPTRPY